MYLRTFASLLLVITTVTAQQVHQRRGFSFRTPRVDPETTPDFDTPSPPTYHSWGDGVPDVGSAPRYGELGSEPAPQYQPAQKPNECLKETCAELTKEVAEHLLDSLQNAVDSSSSSTTAQRVPLATAASVMPLIPNYNVARTMTLDQESLALFDQDEQDMYFDDRMCFYANVERRYASAAAKAPSPTRVAVRDVIDDINSMQTADTIATPLASSEVHNSQQFLWQTVMPNNLASIYGHVSANNSITTATTTCSGLGNAPSITMSFVQARVSTHSPTPTPETSSNMVEGAASATNIAGGSAIFGAIVAVVALITV